MIPRVEPARHGDEADTCFHQPAREQRSLPQRGVAVFLADRIRLLGDLKSFLGPGGMHQTESSLIVGIHACGDAGGIELTEFLIDHGQQRTAMVHASPVDSHGQIQIADFIRFGVGITGVKRVELRSQET